MMLLCVSNSGPLQPEAMVEAPHGWILKITSLLPLNIEITTVTVSTDTPMGSHIQIDSKLGHNYAISKC